MKFPWSASARTTAAPVPDLTIEAALALCAKKWGTSASITVTPNGGPDTTAAERASALDLLGVMKGLEPARLPEQWPPETTLIEYEAARTAHLARWEGWYNRTYKLEKLAHQFSYTVQRARHDGYALSDSFGRGSYTVRDALVKAGVIEAPE